MGPTTEVPPKPVAAVPARGIKKPGKPGIQLTIFDMLHLFHPDSIEDINPLIDANSRSISAQPHKRRR